MESAHTMLDISPYDATHWKDSGLRADTVQKATEREFLGKKGNMITRLIFDEECPMPGRQVLSQEYVIKFFMKAEGHKGKRNLRVKTDRLASAVVDGERCGKGCDQPSIVHDRPAGGCQRAAEDQS